MVRMQAKEQSIHSGEMEGAYVSAEFREDSVQYVRGDISIEDLMRRTKRRWNIHISDDKNVAEVR